MEKACGLKKYNLRQGSPSKTKQSKIHRKPKRYPTHYRLTSDEMLSNEQLASVVTSWGLGIRSLEGASGMRAKSWGGGKVEMAGRE